MDPTKPTEAYSKNHISAAASWNCCTRWRMVNAYRRTFHHWRALQHYL